LTVDRLRGWRHPTVYTVARRDWHLSRTADFTLHAAAIAYILVRTSGRNVSVSVGRFTCRLGRWASTCFVVPPFGGDQGSGILPRLQQAKRIRSDVGRCRGRSERPLNFLVLLPFCGGCGTNCSRTFLSAVRLHFAIFLLASTATRLARRRPSSKMVSWGWRASGVREEYRRQGIGSAITLAALETARNLGCRLGVLSSSPMAMSMYEDLGFRQYGTGHCYLWSPEADEVETHH
jgi:GNAT superfamily N-acetyltransferase